MHRLLAPVFAALLITAACADDTDDDLATDGDGRTTTNAPTTTSGSTGDAELSCSAADVSADPDEQADLPDPVAVMRQQIINAATACNYDELEELALQGDSRFTYSFGEDGDPAEYWRIAEERHTCGELGAEEHGVLEILAGLLNRPYGVTDGGDETIYVWPSASTYGSWSEVPAEDQKALKPLYDEEDFEHFEELFAYIGYRVGITAAGDWIFFVAGD
ncbi:MAG: hypothetical protein ACRDZV_00410 [Acidimicrobiia bacterium]